MKFFAVLLSMCFLGASLASAQDACEGQPTGDCYCKCVKYEPCYYKTNRCEYVEKCQEVKHCRWVAQPYEKQCIRYVPECYTEVRTRYVPETYVTLETRKVPVWRCDVQCKMVPKYYYQHVCQPQAECEQPCYP